MSLRRCWHVAVLKPHRQLEEPSGFNPETCDPWPKRGPWLNTALHLTAYSLHFAALRCGFRQQVRLGRWAAYHGYRTVERDINRMLAQDSVLFGNYTLRVLDNAEFNTLFRQYRPLIFQTMLDFDVQQALSMEEQTATARLRERMGTRFRLNIGLYHHQAAVSSCHLSSGVSAALAQARLWRDNL